MAAAAAAAAPEPPEKSNGDMRGPENMAAVAAAEVAGESPLGVCPALEAAPPEGGGDLERGSEWPEGGGDLERGSVSPEPGGAGDLGRGRYPDGGGDLDRGSDARAPALPSPDACKKGVLRESAPRGASVMEASSEARSSALGAKVRLGPDGELGGAA